MPNDFVVPWVILINCLSFAFSDLPHSPLPSPCDVCLIVKDLEKGIKVDHEPTANHFKEVLSGKGIGPELVSTIMPLRELRVEYNTYEARNALCGKFDVILVRVEKISVSKQEINS